MTHIDEIPDRVLAMVLDFCPKSELYKIKDVSRKWSNLIDKYLGLALIIGLEPGILVKELQRTNTRSIVCDSYFQSIAMLKNKVKAVAIDGRGDETDKTEHPKLKNPDTTSKLCFVGHIPIQTSGPLLQSCKNLRGLHFHMSALSGIQPSLPLKLDIPTLKTLVIDSFGIKELWKLTGENPNAFINWDSAYKVIIKLLQQNQFFHLEKLIVDIPFFKKMEKEMTTTLSRFLSNHYSSLEGFCYHQGFKITLSENDDEVEEDEDVEMEDEEECEEVSSKSLAVIALELKKVNLIDIHFGFYCQQETDVLWKNYILHQNKMRRLISTGGSIQGFPFHTIEENAKTLKTVILELRDNVDLNAFIKCDQLTKLTLIGTINDDDEDPTVISLTNLDNLPVSLETLTIHRLKFHRQDATGILCKEKWTNLKNIEFIDCGNEADTGVSILAIDHIWNEKRLKRFCLDGSLNSKSLREPIPKHLQLLVHVILADLNGTNFKVEGHLNERGEYKNVGYDGMFQSGEKDLFAFPEELGVIGARPNFWVQPVEEADSEGSEEDESDGQEIDDEEMHD